MERLAVEIELLVKGAREAVLELRRHWKEARGPWPYGWRLTQRIEVALDNAEHRLGSLISDLEAREDGRPLAPAAVPVGEKRHGGLRMKLLKSTKREHEPLLCPMVYCDACGELIEGSGNLLYAMDNDANSPGYGSPLTGEIFFFHKGHDRWFEKQVGGRWYWDELQLLPVRLAANLSLQVRGSGSGLSGPWIIKRPKQGQPASTGQVIAGQQQAPQSQQKPAPRSIDPRRVFSAMQKQEILLRSNGHCVSCGQELGLDWHADHIYPHSLGGTTEVINGQALCQPCNARKRAKVLTVDES